MKHTLQRTNPTGCEVALHDYIDQYQYDRNYKRRETIHSKMLIQAEINRNVY